METETVQRKGTKPPKDVTLRRKDVIVALLSRSEGATTLELIEATETSKQNISLWLKKLGAVRTGKQWKLKAG